MYSGKCFVTVLQNLLVYWKYWYFPLSGKNVSKRDKNNKEDHCVGHTINYYKIGKEMMNRKQKSPQCNMNQYIYIISTVLKGSLQSHRGFFKHVSGAFLFWPYWQHYAF